MAQHAPSAPPSPSSPSPAPSSAVFVDPLHLEAIVGFLRGRLPYDRIDVGIVCGSGLSGLSSAIESPVSVSYADIPHFPVSTVAGHGSELVFGTLGGKTVCAARGRFHYYEGHSDPTLGLLCAGVLAGLVGLLVGRLVRGISGVALLMITLGLNMLLYDLVQRATDITGGDDGLQGIEVASLLGQFKFDMFGHTAYIYTLLVVFVLFLLS